MHTAPRIHVPAALHEGATIQATPAQAHHLATVLRHTQGDLVRLFNGADGEHTATITLLRKSALEFTVGPQLRPQSPEPTLTLIFALLKRDATDLVIQKATELGASSIRPVLTERTNAARVNLDRLTAIATDAAIQCERLTLPTIHDPEPLTTLLGHWPPATPIAAAIERHPNAPRPATQSALLIGPEGGFTPRELDVLGSTPFIHPVSLGPRILRADTAAIAGLALLLAHHP
jgi:16S rRNA (uracil1498-N3)-methyltransferase